MSDRLLARPLARRLCLLAALVVVTPLGFWTKVYDGPAHTWFNHYGGGALYEVFWILVIALLVPTRRAVSWIASGVFLVTCALEVAQLWHPAWLLAIRQTYLGKVLLGTTFAWWDFPHYVLGSALGYAFVTAMYGRVPATQDRR